METIPVDVRSKSQGCGHLIAEIFGSISADGKHFLLCVHCVLCRGGFSDKLITRSVEFYWLCMFLILYDLLVGKSATRRPSSDLGCCTTAKKSLCSVVLLQQLTVSRIVCSLLIHYCVNTSSPLFLILSRMNPIQTFSLSPNLLESIFILYSYLNLGPIIFLFSSGFLIKCCKKELSHACHMQRPSNPS